MKIQILQHSQTDTPALINDWILARNHQASVAHVYKNEIPNSALDFDFLIVLGGDMNVDQEDKHPWLKTEKKFIETCLKNNKTTLGICLGGQLIAEVLGASVKKNHQWEIGWHPVEMTAPSAFTKNWPNQLSFFHWHEYTFDLPSGAKHLARSEACENQAYLYGSNVFGVQFHPEVTEKWISAALTPPHPAPGRFIQSPSAIRGNMSAIHANKPHVFQLLDALAAAKS